MKARSLLSGLVLASLLPAMTPAFAHADPAHGAIVDIGRPPRVPTALDSMEHPWPGVALALSAAGTAAPIVAMSSLSGTRSQGLGVALLAAEIVGPSAGHLYAGLGRRAAIGIITRCAGFGIATIGAVRMGLWAEGNGAEWSEGVIEMLIGAGIMAGSAIVDVVTVAPDVQRHNDELVRARAVFGVRPSPGGAPAIALTVKF
jgi:hypothetical protein